MNNQFEEQQINILDIIAILSFVIGLILGFRLSLISLILSSFLALPYSVASLKLQKNKEVPFGPFLVSSLFIVFLFYDKFINIINLF